MENMNVNQKMEQVVEDVVTSNGMLIAGGVAALVVAGVTAYGIYKGVKFYKSKRAEKEANNDGTVEAVVVKEEYVNTNEIQISDEQAEEKKA